MYGAALKKHNETLLELMSDILLNPVFKEEELEKIRKQTLSALAYNRNDPSAISEDVSDVLFFGKDHPYGEILTESSVNMITTAMCETYYKTWFRPNVAYLAIVGDLNLKEARKLVKKYFGAWQRSEVPRYKYSTPEAPGQLSIAIVDRPHAVQSNIKVGYPVEFNLGSEDYIKARVMNVLLGGGSYRLYKNLRETHAYTYGAYSSLNHDKYIGYFQATADVRNEVTDSAVYQIIYEMERLRDEPVPEDELEIVKNYLTGSFSLALENPATVAQFALNTARFNLPSDYYANYLKMISEVTPADIQEMAEIYLKPDKAYILVVGKGDEIEKGLAALNQAISVEYYDAEGNYVDPSERAKPLPDGLTSADVIEGYLEALGGRKVLQSVQDEEMKAEMEMQGMILRMGVYRKSPNLLKINLTMSESLLSRTVFDGETGTQLGMQGNKTLEGDELEQLRSEAIFMPELDYAGHGFETSLISVDNIEGSDCYKLEIIDPSGIVTEEYFAVETGLKLRSDEIMETPDGAATQITIFSDYRNIEGILVPHTLKISVGPQSITSTVRSIRFNTGMDMSVFK